MPLPARSEITRLWKPDTFFWATGIEDTFISDPWPATGRTLDEYELTGHYDRLLPDCDLVASLGVTAVRYGVPWHRIQPAPDVWDWSFADTALGGLLDRGVEPIVDLVHYGLPRWLEGAYLHPDFPAHMAEYAGRLAERFRGRLRWYTPLNEPRITAWYCGRLGWWPPFRRGWPGFVAVMLAVCRGIVATVRAMEAVDPEIVPAHVDATDLFDADPGSPDELHVEAAFRQELVFLALDLVSGRIQGPAHPLYNWLIRQRASPADLDWFVQNAVDLPVIGLNLYPMFTRKRVVLTPAGGKRIRMPYGDGSLLTRLGKLYFERYGCPLFVSETAASGGIWRRGAWLDESVKAVRELRAAGIPMVGYTWWPMFSLVAWAYRQGTKPPESYLETMGLWDLDSATLERRETPLVDAYRTLAKAGHVPVGERL